jgi:hypothetical protein
VTEAITARTVVIERAMGLVTSVPEGAAHAARLGWTLGSARSPLRASLYGTVQGSSLLQSVVLARWVERLLDDTHFTQWAALAAPKALAALRVPEGVACGGFDPVTGSLPGSFAPTSPTIAGDVRLPPP